MKKLIFYVCVSHLIVTGCSTRGVDDNPPNGGNSVKKNEQAIQPPRLVLHIGKEEVEPILGSYQWEEAGKAVETASPLPHEVFKNKNQSKYMQMMKLYLDLRKNRINTKWKFGTNPEKWLIHQIKFN